MKAALLTTNTSAKREFTNGLTVVSRSKYCSFSRFAQTLTILFAPDVFEGPWKSGERDGAVCIYRKTDGGVEYSAYASGEASGDGIFWEPDRKKAFKLLNGEQKGQMSLAAAEKLAKEKFNLPVPKK